ncbi:uncharacterized protein LOC128954439 [Oppia nitens]|uniref:uncharacterized protein LOC128954439 n=1 Tax=Oppia nitens TaxID=1686743 RepID=UPI0023DC966B|nr:uncharacterized protein LOC128954439 [Oppia nitens]
MTTTTMMSAKNSFDRFGDDLCQLLLTYLAIDDRLRLQSVSKQWLALIFNTQTHLVIDKNLLKRLSLDSIRDYYQTIKLFQVIVRKCPNITAIILSKVYLLDRFLDLLVKYCYRLRHINVRLDYDGHWSVIDVRMFDCFFRKFGQQLLTFKFDSYNTTITKKLFYKVIDSMPNLKKLDITYNSRRKSIIQLNDLIVGDMSYDLPKSLDSLNIKLNNSSVPLFSRFADIYGHKLTSLTIVSDIKIADQDLTVNCKTLIEGLAQMLRLKHLKLVLLEQLVDNFVGHLFSTIGRNCRQLKALDCMLKISSKLTIECMFDSINKHMSRQLKLLSINFWPNYDNQYLTLLLTSDLFNRLLGLTHLRLCSDKKFRIIGDQFFRDINRNLPRLQYICCDRVFITEESIKSMGQLAHLTDVYIRCDTNTLQTSESFIKQHLLIDSNVKYLYINNSKHVYIFKDSKYNTRHYIHI